MPSTPRLAKMALSFAVQVVPSGSGTSTVSRGMLISVTSDWSALMLASMIVSLLVPLPLARRARRCRGPAAAPSAGCSAGPGSGLAWRRLEADRRRSAGLLGEAGPGRRKTNASTAATPPAPPRRRPPASDSTQLALPGFWSWRADHCVPRASGCSGLRRRPAVDQLVVIARRPPVRPGGRAEWVPSAPCRARPGRSRRRRRSAGRARRSDAAHGRYRGRGGSARRGMGTSPRAAATSSSRSWARSSGVRGGGIAQALVATRWTWVSTGTAGRPKPKRRMIEAVLRPMPGSETSQSRASSSGWCPGTRGPSCRGSRRGPPPARAGCAAPWWAPVPRAECTSTSSSVGAASTSSQVDVPGAQRREGTERVGVGRVLRQDGQHQLADRVQPRPGPGRVARTARRAVRARRPPGASLATIGGALLRAWTAPARAFAPPLARALARISQGAPQRDARSAASGPRARRHWPAAARCRPSPLPGSSAGRRSAAPARTCRMRRAPLSPAPAPRTAGRPARCLVRASPATPIAALPDKGLLVRATLAGDHQVGALQRLGQSDHLGHDLDPRPHAWHS